MPRLKHRSLLDGIATKDRDMKTSFSIDGHAYTLHTAFNGTNAGDVIEQSRHYNDGLDFFHGSDSTTATVFLVAKEKVPLFVRKLESFMRALASASVRRDTAEDLLELTEYFNFAVLHKSIEGGPFDFFVTNFMFDWFPERDAAVQQLSESTGAALSKLSSMVLSVGSAYGDASMEHYARAYLAQRGLLAPDFDGCPMLGEDFTYEELVPVFNEPPETILPQFLAVYFRHTPGPKGKLGEERWTPFWDAIERLET